MSETRTIAADEDPVCGMKVDVDEARTKGLTFVGHGHEHVFCSRGCKLDFEDDPRRYLDPTYQPHTEM